MTTPPREGLSLEHLSVDYGATRAVHDVSASVQAGQILVLVGPSGCGKSTILKAITGLLPPSTGRIRLVGRDITDLPPQRRRLGYVPQNYALFPTLSVLGNVEFGLRRHGVAAAERRRRAHELLEFVQLPELADRRPGQLSGGQRQRVALARALATDPDALLLDEPLSALDPQLRTSMRQQLHDLLRSVGCVTVLVTHDRTEALALADRIAVVHAGSIVQLGTPQEIWARPADAFVADFLDAARLIPAERTGDDVTLRLGAGAEWHLPWSTVRTDSDRTVPAPIRGALIRESTLQVSDAAEAFWGDVVRTEFVGDSRSATLRLGDTLVTMRVPPDLPLGARVRVVPRRGALDLV